VFVYNQSGTFVVPEGVTNLVVEAWGGGGGPRNDGTQRRGGGGGGAYARANVPVVPGQTYPVTVGAGGTIYHAGEVGNPGGDSWFGDGAWLLARGGSGGTDTGGAGGSAAASVGDVKYSGGAGGNRGQFTGGAGGGSAFIDAVGGAGENGGARSDTALGGAGTGDGGNGGANANPGTAGSAPGGGGGARGTNGGNGGNGAPGRVVITYQVPLADPWLLDTNADGIPDGWYLSYDMDPAVPGLAGEDSDGDGMTNWQEFLADTDPTDPDHVLVLEANYTSAVVEGTETGVIRYTFPASTGRFYRLVFSTNLMSPTLVYDIGWGTPDPDGFMTLTNQTPGMWAGTLRVILPDPGGP